MTKALGKVFIGFSFLDLLLIISNTESFEYWSVVLLYTIGCFFYLVGSSNENS